MAITTINLLYIEELLKIFGLPLKKNSGFNIYPSNEYYTKLVDVPGYPFHHLLNKTIECTLQIGPKKIIKELVELYANIQKNIELP